MEDISKHRIKSGDRVVISVPIGQEYEAEVLMTKLQDQAVEVELRYEKMYQQSSLNLDNTKVNDSLSMDTNQTDLLPEETNPLQLFETFVCSM